MEVVALIIGVIILGIIYTHNNIKDIDEVIADAKKDGENDEPK